MKKLLILSLLFLPAFAYEDVPLLVNTSTVNIETKQDDSNLINIKNLKKYENNKEIPNKQKLKVDTKQIHHQRTLDYMTKPGNSTLPPIF